MKKGGHSLLTVFLCSLCVLLGIFIGRNRRDDYEILTPNTEVSTVAEEQPVEDCQLDINTATVLQLQDLPGIGETLAKRIVDYREINGAFQTVGDLMNVEGIGEKKLQAINALIKVGG